MKSDIQITDGKDGIKIVSIKHSLGINNNKEFQNSMIDLINNGIRKIILDFHDLTIADSLGISTLIMLSKIIKESGGEFVIINCREQILSLLKPINLQKLVKIYNKYETKTDYFSD